jgi:hypothetical protein
VGSVAFERLHNALADAREHGEPFDAVFRRAVRAAGPPAELRHAIFDTADAWRRAFEGEPATRAESAALVLDGLWWEDAA